MKVISLTAVRTKAAVTYTALSIVAEELKNRE